MTQRFSRRNNLIDPPADIKIRNDAPEELRSILVDVAYEAGLVPHSLRAVVCKVLRVAADPNNWSAYPNVDWEVRWALEGCAWYHVCDVIEEIHTESMKRDLEPGADYFENEINAYFGSRGIGWQLSNGRIETRGSEVFEDTVQGALDVLERTGRSTANAELREARLDISRRPEADVTGAIQHAMAALECVARDITGDTGSTLGKIISDNPNLLPKPLDQAIEKAWGYSSNNGRHLREDRAPSYEEAQLVLGIASSVCTYLVAKAAGVG